MYSALVGGLPVVACVSVFSSLPFCGVVGLQWGAEVTRLCVYLCWFPAVVPARVYQPTIASLCNTQDSVVFEKGVAVLTT